MEMEDESLGNISIDEKELHLTKVEIHQDALKNRKESDNDNPDTIILPRRVNGKYTKERYASNDRSRPSFKRDYSIEVKTTIVM